MNSAILISVIVPCYNQGRFLPEALNSLLAQTYSNWECFIINDGSTDNTETVALQYAKIDPRFRYIKKTNGGVSSARNEGLKYITGDYIKFLDADDWIDKQSFEYSLANKSDLIISTVKSYWEQTGEFEAYYCNLYITDFSFRNVVLNWAVNFDIPIHAALISSKLLKGYNFNEGLELREDWIMWLHIFIHSPSIYLIDTPLAVYRKWNNSATTNINKTLANDFLAYQYAVNHFDIEKEISNELFSTLFNKMIKRTDYLEQSNNHLKNSTSFRISYFFVSAIKRATNFFLLSKK